MRIILKYSFIVLFCLLLVKQFSFAFSFNDLPNKPNDEIINYSNNQNSNNFEFKTLSLPFDCTIYERETKDENETEESNDEDGFFSLFTSNANELINYNSLKSKIFEIISSTQNRNRISLIILYQSWKSYIE